MSGTLINGALAAAWHAGWSHILTRRPRGRRQALVRQETLGV